jgi:multidrug transporter EmrE-like cation transporter
MDSNIARIVLSEALGDLSFAKFVEDGRRNELLKGVGYAAYISVLESFQDSIEKKGLLWSNGMWDGWSNLATGAVAIGVMGERASPKELLGYVLISAGIFLVGSNGSKKVR